MKGDTVVGAVLILLSISCALAASTFNVAFLTDPVGPKALPYLVAALLFLAGVHALRRPRDELAWPDRAARARIAGASGAFLVYALALPWVGFFAATTITVAVLARLFGAAVPRGLAAAALLSAGLWLLFVRILALPLPIGDLWMR